MKRVLLTLILVVCGKAYAEGALHAHEHGSIDFEVAVEGKNAEFEISGPAESFIGFEHVAKTAKEKKVLEDAKNLWNNKFFEVVTFDPTYKCQSSNASFEHKIEKGDHSEIAASIKVSCEKDLKGAKVLVKLRSHFKNIKKLKMELVGNETKVINITKPSMEVIF